MKQDYSLTFSALFTVLETFAYSLQKLKDQKRKFFKLRTLPEFQIWEGLNLKEFVSSLDEEDQDLANQTLAELDKLLDQNHATESSQPEDFWEEGDCFLTLFMLSQGESSFDEYFTNLLFRYTWIRQRFQFLLPAYQEELQEVLADSQFNPPRGRQPKSILTECSYGATAKTVFQAHEGIMDDALLLSYQPDKLEDVLTKSSMVLQDPDLIQVDLEAFKIFYVSLNAEKKKTFLSNLKWGIRLPQERFDSIKKTLAASDLYPASLERIVK